MNTESLPKLHAAIVADDVEVFSACYEEAPKLLNYSFGRFPVLSLCYLYESKRILKAFEKKFPQADSYLKTGGEWADFQKFKTVAGKCLRLYVATDAIVEPTEMLAILGKSAMLGYAFSHNKPDLKATEKLQKIYAIRGQNASFEGAKPKLPPERLDRRKKPMLFASWLIALIFIAVSCFATYKVFSFGVGTAESPIMLSNSGQLALAFKNDVKYCSLNTDAVLNAPKTAEFNGVLEGNGANVTVKDQAEPLFSSFGGTISNLNLVFESFANLKYLLADTITEGAILNNVTISVAGGKALPLIGTNNGEITALTATYGDITEVSHAGLIALSNVGTVQNSSLKLGKISASTVNTAGLIFGENSGKIAGFTADFDPIESQNLTNAALFLGKNAGQVSNLTLNYPSIQSVSAGGLSLIADTNSNSIESIAVTAEVGITLNSDTAMLVKTNAGTLKNAEFSIDGTIKVAESVATTVTEAPTLLISGAVLANSGKITAVKLTPNLTLTGVGTIDASYSGLVAENTGTVDNSSSEDGTVIADTVDLSGLIGINNSTATLANCVNRTALTQNTSVVGWSPNVSGLVNTNNGTVTDCQNFGALTAVSTATELVANPNQAGAYYTTYIFIGGLVANNAAVIQKSTNSGVISATMTIGAVYIGGLIFDNANSGRVSECINNGTISVQSYGNTIYAAGGFAQNLGSVEKITNSGAIIAEADTQNSTAMRLSGISAYNGGIMNECRNTGTLSSVSGTGSARLGGLIAENYGGSIKTSRSDADIAVNAGKADVFVGGAVGYAEVNTYYTLAESCGAFGEIKVEANTEAFVFVGGICGYNAGYVKTSFAGCTFDLTAGEGDANRTYCGGILGTMSNSAKTEISNFYAGNVFVARNNLVYEDVALGYGSYLMREYGNFFEYRDVPTRDKTLAPAPVSVADTEALQAEGVYWE